MLWDHVLRNAGWCRVLTVMGLQFANLVTGTVVIGERVLAARPRPADLQAIGNRDLPLVQALVMLIAATVITINFVVDLRDAVIDPRLKMVG